MTLRYQESPRHQHGAALLVALIFLLLLSIIAIAASERSLLQERMAGGLRNAQQAQISAETALRGAEWALWSRTATLGGRFNCLNGSISNDDGCTTYNPADPLYGPTGDVTTFRTSQGWITTIGHVYKGANNSTDYTSSSLGTAQLANNPIYLIEDMGTEQPPDTGAAHESGATGSNNTAAGQLTMHIFRITTRATGGNANAVRVVQSTFDAQVNN